ncbi:LysR family transcriptional regulator [Desulfurispira natronophila]|uniref:DNA-binding transcriptional LysR family regulator n=1 Tax=Desulfurispira natronophila TaxID=682562 RepID=A0A7W8DHQ3_9BACT|nr:LysR family transcriptional regulator [Desulfurispira natronophila]MBB5022533.1 DNA-binding transcriptional LysR family regulator [Desulfurispira natronophila]
MEHYLLETFVKVAQTGSVTRAASELGCVQSNVTTRIHKLEESLGKPLFWRKNRRMIITEAGQALLPYALKILELQAEARSHVQQTRFEQKLTIGSTESCAALHLSSILLTFHQQFPHVQLELVTGTTAEMQQQTAQQKLDCAFVNNGVAIAKGLHTEPFVMETMCIVGKQKGASNKTGVTVLAFRRGCSYRDFFEQHLRQCQVPIEKTLEFGSLEALLTCAAAGMGYTLLPKGIVDKMVQQPLQVPDIAVPPPLATSIIHHWTGDALPPQLHDFLTLCRQYAKGRLEK